MATAPIIGQKGATGAIGGVGALLTKPKTTTPKKPTIQKKITIAPEKVEFKPSVSTIKPMDFSTKGLTSIGEKAPITTPPKTVTSPFKSLVAGGVTAGSEGIDKTRPFAISTTKSQIKKINTEGLKMRLSFPDFDIFGRKVEQPTATTDRVGKLQIPISYARSSKGTENPIIGAKNLVTGVVKGLGQGWDEGSNMIAKGIENLSKKRDVFMEKYNDHIPTPQEQQSMAQKGALELKQPKTTITEDIADIALGVISGPLLAAGTIAAPEAVLPFMAVMQNQKVNWAVNTALQGAISEQKKTRVGRALVQAVGEERADQALNALNFFVAAAGVNAGVEYVKGKLPSGVTDMVALNKLANNYSEDMATLFGRDYKGPDPSPEMIKTQTTKILRENHPDVPGANVELYKKAVQARDRLLDTQGQIKQIQQNINMRVKEESIKGKFKETIDLLNNVKDGIGKKIMDFLNSHPRGAVGIEDQFLKPKVAPSIAPQGNIVGPLGKATLAEQVQSNLNEKQKNKVISVDLGERVSGSRKEKAQYKMLSIDSLAKVELESSAMAYDLVSKDRVIEPYDTMEDKLQGTDAGVIFLKKKLIDAINKKPADEPLARQNYVKYVPEIVEAIKQAKTMADIQSIGDRFKVLQDWNGKKSLLLDNGDTDLMSSLGPRFQALLKKRNELATQTWLEATKMNKLTPEERQVQVEAISKVPRANIESYKQILEDLKTPEGAQKQIQTFREKQKQHGDTRKMTDKEILEMLERNNTQNILTSERRLDEKIKTFIGDVRENNYSWMEEKHNTQKTESGMPTIHSYTKIDNIERIGGREIDASILKSPKAIMDQYGYKSVQFGNYMTDDVSLHHIENFLESMIDLQDTLGLDLKNINQDRGLSISFGARGSGKAMAHFEPLYEIINLTKGKGDGSVAHEWGHFLDNMLGDKAGTIKEKGSTYLTEDRSNTINDTTYGQIKKIVIEMMNYIKNEGKVTLKKVYDVPSKISGTYPSIKSDFEKGGVELAKKNIEGYVRGPSAETRAKNYYGYLAYLAQNPVTVEVSLKGTKFFNDAKDLGKYRMKNAELRARAWSAYIQDSMMKTGKVNNYLVRNNVGAESFTLKDGTKRAFDIHPQGIERETINQYFDQIIDLLRQDFKAEKFTAQEKNGAPIENKEITVEEIEATAKPQTHFQEREKAFQDEFGFPKEEAIVEEKKTEKNIREQFTKNTPQQAVINNLQDLYEFRDQLEKTEQTQDVKELTTQNNLDIKHLESLLEDVVVEETPTELTTEQKAHLKGLSVEEYNKKFGPKVSAKDLKGMTDPVSFKFIKEVARIEAMEQRIGKVAGKTVSGDVRKAQHNARVRAKDTLIEQIAQEYGLSANDAQDKYDAFANASDKQIRQTKTQEKEKLKEQITGEKTTLKDSGVDIEDIISQMEAIPEKISQPGALGSEADSRMRIKSEIKKLIDRTVEEIKGQTKMGNIYAESKDLQFQIRQLTKQMVRYRNYGNDIEMMKKYNAIHTKIGELKLRQSLYASVNKRIGDFEKQLSEYIKTGAFIKSPRKLQIDHLQKLYRLTDYEMNRIVQGNYNGMKPDERQTYYDRLREKAREIGENKDLQELLALTISTNELRKTENLRNALELPPISEMTNTELRNYIETLSNFEPRQTFLGPRMLQTIDLTSFKGVKTVKDLAKAIANEAGIPYEEIMNRYATMAKFKEEGKGLPQDMNTVGRIEYYLNDAYLKDSDNPLIRQMVGEYRKNNMQQMKSYMDFEKKIEKLVHAARKSTGRSISDRIIPEDKQVFKYIESENKVEMAKDLTAEQLELANEIIDFFAQARDYLVENKQLDAYRSNYITHIEKSWMEKVKNYGIKNAILSMFTKQQQLDFMALGDTGEILGLEKFFKFALSRVEGKYAIDPTQNVAKAVLRYAKSFYTKVGLDTTIPKIEAMAYVLADGKTQKFVKERFNNKKGRRIDYRYQGSRLEQVGMFIKSLTSIVDLGLNIPVAIGSIVGGKYSMVSGQGVIKAGLGHKRYATKQGQQIMDDYQNVIGKSPRKELTDPTKDIFKKGMDSLFILMSGFEHFSRGEFMLGELTKKEFEEGIISPERQAQIKLKIDRTFPAKGTKSLEGSTFVGQLGTQYKGRALPYLQNIYTNGAKILKTWIKKIKEEGFVKGTTEGVKAEKSRYKELFGTMLLSVALFIVIKKLLDVQTVGGGTGDETITPKNGDKSFRGKLEYKIWTEATPIIQSADLTSYTNVRTIGFITSLWNALLLLIKRERYKEAGDDYKTGALKGGVKLKRTLLPSAIRALLPKQNESLGDINQLDLDLSDLDLSELDLSDLDLSSLK